MSTDAPQPPVPPPSRHQLALMIRLAVLPTLTVLNLTMSSLLEDVPVVLRTFVLATVAVPNRHVRFDAPAARLRARLVLRRAA